MKATKNESINLRNNRLRKNEKGVFNCMASPGAGAAFCGSNDLRSLYTTQTALAIDEILGRWPASRENTKVVDPTRKLGVAIYEIRDQRGPYLFDMKTRRVICFSHDNKRGKAQ
jgi:hypothetical protein